MVTTRQGKNQSKPPSAPSPAANRATAARRVKNKVASPVAKRKADILPPPIATGPPSPLRDAGYSSDEFDLDAEDDEPSEQERASDSSVSTTGSQRKKLPGHLLSQLAADIQGRGGIERFSLEAEQALSLLCDQRPELFGTRASKLRLRVGRKVARWKARVKTDPLAWLQILEDLQVTKKPSKAQLDKLSELGDQASKESAPASVKRAKTGSIKSTEETQETPDRVFSPQTVPSTVSVPNEDETMADDKGVEDHFPQADVDPDLHVPAGAELSKCLCSDLSSELSHCTAF